MKFKRFDPFPINPRQAIKIKNLIMMGDSLSDRGTLNKTLLFGCIPMSYVAGLEGHSPDGRFTNGRVWSDHVSAQIASDFTIHRLQKKWHLDDTDISDAVINGDRRVLKAIRESYTLDDDKFINYNGKLWVRSYCAGGLTSHDYSWNLSTSIIRFFTRIIVSKLGQMRDQLLNYDKQHHISNEQKAETVIMEWSGANDLVTVNARPSIEEADKAIAARIDNVKKLIASGYRNFVLFNLPNLALTPRYQALSKEEQDNAQKCSLYFNEQLQKACEQLNEDYPHCSIDPFDINTMFEHIYKNPKKYMFDANKRTQYYIDSKDFDDPSDGLSPASGYMFYDDLHPSADMHALLAAYFYDQLERRYELLEPNQPKINKCQNLPAETLLYAFRKHYETRLTSDQHSFFKSARSNLKFREADLTTIFKHALKENGSRTLEVLKQIGWLDNEGQLTLELTFRSKFSITQN